MIGDEISQAFASFGCERLHTIGDRMGNVDPHDLEAAFRESLSVPLASEALQFSCADATRRRAWWGKRRLGPLLLVVPMVHGIGVHIVEALRVTKLLGELEPRKPWWFSCPAEPPAEWVLGGAFYDKKGMSRGIRRRRSRAPCRTLHGLRQKRQKGARPAWRRRARLVFRV